MMNEYEAPSRSETIQYIPRERYDRLLEMANDMEQILKPFSGRDGYDKVNWMLEKWQAFKKEAGVE